ncbi:MAG: hypothetical protein U0469_02110 [Candidatus Paceibacterota bacterium]|jgi:hypothetical protein
MFPKISEQEVTLIKDNLAPKTCNNVKESLENFYSFTDKLLGLFPKNDFISLWSIFSFSFIQTLLDKYEIKEELNTDPECFIEGEKLLDISFTLKIPKEMFSSLEYKKEIGRFGEVGKELATMHFFFSKEEIQTEREKAVTRTFKVERDFVRINISIDFNGKVEMDLCQFDSFKEQNLRSYQIFYEVYFDRLKIELQKLKLDTSSKITFWSIGDKYQNGHKRDESSIDAILDLKDILSILRTIYSFGFQIGDFPKI